MVTTQFGKPALDRRVILADGERIRVTGREVAEYGTSVPHRRCAPMRCASRSTSARQASSTSAAWPSSSSWPASEDITVLKASTACWFYSSRSTEARPTDGQKRRVYRGAVKPGVAGVADSALRRVLAAPARTSREAGLAREKDKHRRP